ncbi:MAG: right-handed parallel beta-helix repeat-containing protein [Candidatus Marinimicrobia bacterium]|nr:right-handed parallel beta-helix repeat-containing protein [Candidatus Neomarinimicrobiota bacterium]
MKKNILITIIMLFGALDLKANPRILIDGIHGWSTPQSNMSEVMNPAEMFPDFTFDYLDAGDIVIDQVLVSGYLQSSTDTLTFMVPEDSWVLYLRYELGDSTHLQHPYFYLLNPSGEYVTSNCNGVAHVEMPASGMWTLIYSAWDEESTWFEVGTGPHFYSETALESYDMVLQMVDNTFALFKGELPRLSNDELDVISSFMENGGGYLLLRETDMSMVDKPIIHLSSNQTQTVDFNLIFPGVPTFMEPLAQVTTRGSHSMLNWTTQIKANAVSEILYEGRPRQGLNFMTVTDLGSELLVENKSAVNLASIRVLSPQSNGWFRVAYEEYLGSSQSARLSYGPPMSSTDLALRLQIELEQEALELGLSDSEASSFFKHYQWINRLLTKASRSGNPCAIYNFSDEAYQRIIPLKEKSAFSEVVRVMWVLVENVPEKLTVPPLTPERAIQLEGANPEGGSPLVYHEYGVIEEKYPPHASTRDMNLFNIYFEDAILVDETNHLEGNTWAPIFHTFGSHPLAQTLTQGVDEIQGQMSSPITMIDPSNVLIISGDEDTYAEGDETFPPGSYPAVAVAEMFGNNWFVGVNDINILDNHPGNIQFLENCIQTLSGWEPRVIHVPDDVASIQAAIDSALRGDTVLVAPGTYHENINFLGKSIALESSHGAEATIIWGDSSTSVVSFVSGEDQESMLHGFTIRGGNVYDIGPLLIGGGGIRCIGSSPTISENKIISNHCEFYLDGGGIFCSEASPSILDNTISANTGAYYGGGICLRNSSNPLIQGNLIEANITASGWGFAYGAGIFSDLNCNPVIIQNWIQSNIIDTGYGAGVYVRGPQATLISHNIIAGNIGAGIVCTDSSLSRIVNNTIYGNTVGILVETNARPRMVNSVVWENSIVVNQEFDLSAISIAYSNIQNGWEGPGNVDLEPLFTNPDTRDFSLMETSPCVDAGTAFFVLETDTIVNLDSDEYLGNAPDMGSLESPYTVQVISLPIIPADFELIQNYPNPFNPRTTIKYSLPSPASVRLAVFNVMGQEVALLEESPQSAGWHECIWSGKDKHGRTLESGLFFARLETGSTSKVIKMLFLK